MFGIPLIVPVQKEISVQSFFLAFPFCHLLFYPEAANWVYVPVVAKSKEKIELLIIFGQRTAQSPIEGRCLIFKYPYKLPLFNQEKFGPSFVHLTWNDEKKVVINFLDDRVDGRGRKSRVLNSPNMRVVFTEGEETDNVILTTAEKSTKYIDSLFIWVFWRVEGKGFVRMLEGAHHLMLCQAWNQILSQIFPFYFVLFVVPPQLFEVEIHKIAEIFTFSVHPAENDHVLAHENWSMAASPLNWLFIAHFKSSRRPSLKVDKVDGIEADSAFSAHIVRPHPTKDDDKSTLVEDGRMIAASWPYLELLDPRVSVKGVYLSWAEGSTAVASNYHCQIFVDSSSVTLSGFRSPAFRLVMGGRKVVLNIFGLGFDCWFFDNCSYFGIEGWQPFLLVVVDVQNLLIFQGLFNIVV